ncbi:HAD family phosphatase [Streptomyces sp. Ncost-T10-10d]|uniref:HAD family hydrolase n=1 Tax=Streptomyces sp. Ncost-T10-10d TaxID=1839774 RepID=UPI00081E7279|nr:HAD family hydrolase [Streptomyces sp. Ncost-T10-10d]SCF67098.1 haloacid dehalogenase superfamily, subfamily IA, variant 3 with third motif having DD or ED/haloacid dehalogenase superfamily, subfamily IA, variant 1 with third motif having Dx(3-4)D or Dx(3-4)E [Streptomyces sp. Ncost-T10-10d]
MTRSPFDLVIFDCDGVLVDSERICVKVDAAITADLGCSFTEAEIIERFVGSSTEVYTAAVEERLGRRLEKDWQQQYEHLYRAAFEAELTAVDGIAEALNGLTTPVCVASNGDRDGVRRNLEIVALSDHFTGRIFSADDVSTGKPAPDLFLHAARSMGVDPGRCAVIEDSAYGVQAARAAGMLAFGYCGGLTSASRLEGPGTTVFDDMRELPGLLATAPH